MSIPLATTTVTVHSVSEPEPGEGEVETVRAAGVRAVIAAPNGQERPGPGGGSSRVDAVLDADPIAGLAHTDRVTDAAGGTYEVVWVQQRQGLGLGHTVAGLVRKTGREAA